jgi:hypothetical protein
MMAFVAALAAGGVVGWWLARRHGVRHAGDLYSSYPLDRVAALGSLARHPGPTTLRTREDYLHWEPRPALRRRAAAFAAELEAALVSARGGA